MAMLPKSIKRIFVNTPKAAGIARQGDVLLVPAEPPVGPLTSVARDARGRIVLAEGEVTGHAHVVESPLAELFEDRAGMLYLKAPAEAQAALTHEEHGTIPLEGWYRVVRQQQFAPGDFRNPQSRYVMD